MKYKNLKAFAHNFAHWFVSFDYRIDGVCVVDEIREIARSRPDGPLYFRWLPQFETNAGTLSDQANQTIGYYRERLDSHAKNHRVDISSISDFRVEIHRLPSMQLRVESVLIDDRGKEYRQPVSF